jgi:hypothetical protein
VFEDADLIHSDSRTQASAGGDLQEQLGVDDLGGGGRLGQIVGAFQ